MKNPSLVMAYKTQEERELSSLLLPILFFKEPGTYGPLRTDLLKARMCLVAPSSQQIDLVSGSESTGRALPSSGMWSLQALPT